MKLRRAGSWARKRRSGLASLELMFCAPFVVALLFMVFFAYESRKTFLVAEVAARNLACGKAVGTDPTPTIRQGLTLRGRLDGRAAEQVAALPGPLAAQVNRLLPPLPESREAVSSVDFFWTFFGNRHVSKPQRTGAKILINTWQAVEFEKICGQPENRMTWQNLLDKFPALDDYVNGKF